MYHYNSDEEQFGVHNVSDCLKCMEENTEADCECCSNCVNDETQDDD